MYPFSPIALQHLHDAGWTEDRRIDISRWKCKVMWIDFTLVNGRVAWERGAATGALPGRVLRKTG